MIIRPAAPADVLPMAEVNVITRRTCYPGIFPAELLERASPERIAVRWMKNLFTEPNPPGSFGLVAENKGGVVGFIMAGPAREVMLGAGGEMYTLYVLPEYHNRGIGRGLMHHAAERLLQAGFSDFFLWVLTANLPGRTFYERLGGKAINQRLEDVKGYLLDETAYFWSDIPAFIQRTKPNC